jgi:hypothetical protein
MHGWNRNFFEAGLWLNLTFLVLRPPISRVGRIIGTLLYLGPYSPLATVCREDEKRCFVMYCCSYEVLCNMFRH